MDPLHLQERDSKTELSMCDETSQDRFASVTLEHKDESWGFFLSYDQALAMYGWLHAMISR